MRSNSLSPSMTLASRSTNLRGLWGWLIHSLWLALVIIALGLFIGGIPIRTENLNRQYQPTLGVGLSQNRTGEIVLSPWVPILSSGQLYPALQAGILQGDILVAVNGVPVRVEPSQPLDRLLPGGPAGTPVRLTVRTGDHPAREYTLFLGGTDSLALARLGLSVEFITTYAVGVEVVFALICLGIAAVILVRKSNDWLGLLASLNFIFILLGLSAYLLAVYDSEPAWRPALDAWFALILFSLLVFFCLFPDGQFFSPWTLAFVLAGGGWLLAQWLNPRLYPWKMPSHPIGFGIIAAWLGAGIVVQVYRYRSHSSALQRQQTKWVVLGMMAATLGLLGQLASNAWPLKPGDPVLLFNLVGYPATQLLKLLLPLTIAFAILRHRLWDIDSLINRTLVYGGLTGIVVGLYVLIVGGLGTVIQENNNLLLSILATGLIAVLVQPVRDRLQRGVNRLMYGERDDPVTVLSRLGQRLQTTIAPAAVLPALVEAVAQTLKLPYVAITRAVDPAGEVAAACGQPVEALARFPLTHHGEIIGQLVVAPRAPGEAFSPADHHLLENIAHQAGLAVQAVSLTADLQRSRQQLVTAREEERRRLRRDLHDGLGPNLASQGLKLAAVKQLLEQDPVSAAPVLKELLNQVIAQNQTTVDEVRHLVYGLRPPALDELGLVAAIRDYVAGMDGDATLQVKVEEPPEGLPPLSAAVEVAAYRIVLEALTNVIRHAHAQQCLIRCSLEQSGSTNVLQVEIGDDGLGLPPAWQSGVGSRSMRERAEEVGGACVIEPAANRGTCVRVRLPVMSEQVGVDRRGFREATTSVYA